MLGCRTWPSEDDAHLLLWGRAAWESTRTAPEWWQQETALAHRRKKANTYLAGDGWVAVPGDGQLASGC